MRQMLLLFTMCLFYTSFASADNKSFAEKFIGGKMDSRWQAHCSTGNTITFQDGAAQINANLNTYAYISRPVNAHSITVSTRIKPSNPAGMSWCTSIFLVWDSGNWCQMGMLSAPAGGSCYYAVETRNGVTTETYLDHCDLSGWRYVRIQLAKDCIRYYAGDDGKVWKYLRVIERPSEFSKSPASLAVGKGYGRGVAPYSNPGLSNDYSDRGAMVISRIAGIIMEKTPDELLLMTADDRKKLRQADLDPVGIMELQGREDTSYEKVSKYYPPMKYPKEAVGVPEHPVDIAIDYLGRLQLNYDQPLVAWLEIGSPAVPFGNEKARITRRWLNGYIPVLTLKTRHDNLEYEQTIFGWSEGFSPDRPLYGYMRIVARAKTGGKVPDTVTFVSGSGKKRTEYPLTQISPGQAEACMKFSWPAANDVVTILPAEFNKVMNDTANHWERIIKQAAHFETPEKRVNEAYKAWIAYSQLNVDKINGIYEPHDGIGFYEENYGYSVTLHCIALDMYGMHDKAQLYIDSILHFQGADGLYTQNFGVPDMGTLLLALAEHYNYTGDKEWLKRVSPNMIRAADWLIRRRAITPKEGVLKGLIKYRAYCDYLEPVYDYLSDTYCCVGMNAAAKALGDIGMTDDAKRIADEARAYRADILASMDAAVFTREDRVYLPLEPETHRLLKDSNYTGGDYYGLVTGCLLENEFLPANDKRSHLLTDLMEQKNGLIAGLCKFQPGGIDHAYTYGYLMTQLRRGDARKVILGFYSMLAYGMTRDTYSGVECTNVVTGANYWTLPHLYSATQQLRLLRHMILREEGDILLIGEAVPRAWLADGKSVNVTSAPTRFGEMSAAITSHVGSGNISVKLIPPVRIPPRRVVVTLRHPKFKPIRSITLDGQKYSNFKGEKITLEGFTKPVTLHVSYK